MRAPREQAWLQQTHPGPPSLSDPYPWRKTISEKKNIVTYNTSVLLCATQPKTREKILGMIHIQRSADKVEAAAYTDYLPYWHYWYLHDKGQIKILWYNTMIRLTYPLYSFYLTFQGNCGITISGCSSRNMEWNWYYQNAAPITRYLPATGVPYTTARPGKSQSK